MKQRLHTAARVLSVIIHIIQGSDLHLFVRCKSEPDVSFSRYLANIILW